MTQSFSLLVLFVICRIKTDIFNALMKENDPDARVSLTKLVALAMLCDAHFVSSVLETIASKESKDNDRNRKVRIIDRQNINGLVLLRVTILCFTDPDTCFSNTLQNSTESISKVPATSMEHFCPFLEALVGFNHGKKQHTNYGKYDSRVE